MDIVTHAGIGLIAASPFLADRPELALGIVAGSVLPDLDALYRVANSVAFLRAHQTWSHALPVHLALSIAAGAFAAFLGWKGTDLAAGLLTGFVGHSLLDLTNTYGVAWFIPFSRRRFCFEWVFFIDAVVFTSMATVLAALVPIWVRQGVVPGAYAAGFFALLAAYVFGKGILRQRAGSFCPGAKSLVPSALVPWRFFGTERHQNAISLFAVNAITGARSTVGEVPLLDDPFATALDSLPEFHLMRQVSPEYHVVSASAEGAEMRLLCRDLRMRNFGTRFGDLEIWLDSNRQVTRRRFYV
jgi:membrane-bound metal-dependent hydrolase YbcI (DUF457 family)